MVKGFETQLGTVNFTEEVIATIAGIAATECYGLVGMAPRSMQDGLAELLNRENFSRGVDVKLEDGKLVIGLHIVVEYGTRIATVADNVMGKVKYSVEHLLGLEVDRVQINVQGVRVSDVKTPAKGH
ncbi:MAG: Asp23/Gls24 family envelope stress response protein [Limnochordia bacterium]